MFFVNLRIDRDKPPAIPFKKKLGSVNQIAVIDLTVQTGIFTLDLDQVFKPLDSIQNNAAAIKKRARSGIVRYKDAQAAGN